MFNIKRKQNSNEKSFGKTSHGIKKIKQERKRRKTWGLFIHVFPNECLAPFPNHCVPY